MKTRCQTQNRAAFETITGQDKGESVPKTWAFLRREHRRQASFDDEEKKCFCSRSTIKYLGVSMARQTFTIFPPPEILKTCTARIWPHPPCARCTMYEGDSFMQTADLKEQGNCARGSLPIHTTYRTSNCTFNDPAYQLQKHNVLVCARILCLALA